MWRNSHNGKKEKTIMKKRWLKPVVYIFCFAATLLLIIVNIANPVHDDFSTRFIFPVMAILALPLFLKYGFYMLLAPWYRHVTNRRLKQYNGASFFPGVSVIIPAWNEEIGIINTIKSAAASDYGNLEIIVVNDGSTDNTDIVVRKFLEEYGNNAGGPEIIYRNQPNGGKASALNTGIALSRGEIIITIDADSIMKKNAVSAFVRYFHNPQVMSVAGNIKVGNTRHITGTVQHLEYLVTFYMKKVESIMDAVYIVGGAAAAYRREIFDKIGFFNQNSITEDIEMSMKILEAGYKIHYAEDAVVYTEGAGNLRDLIKQRLRWKRGRFSAFYTFRKLFFSREKKHNKLLTFFILPFGVLAEVKLLFELFFLAVLFLYSLFTSNFTILLMCAMVSSTIFLVKSLFFRKTSRLNLYPFIFIGWLLFYIAAFVEHVALIRTIWGILNKQTIKWQSWQRKGVFEDE